ncbi:SET domain-containing protein [Flavobacteriaceae bacterium M23B6Z8]
MIHPSTVLQFISDEIGYGVVAKERIPKGTITWVQDELDIVITPSKLDEMSPIYQKTLDYYTFRNHEGNYILCWDHAKFVNHSFKSNCLTTPYDFEIAIRDIEVGEELTDDYGYLNIAKPFRAADEGTKRKTVYPDDLLKYHHKWDKLIKGAFFEIGNLPQPLFEIFSKEALEQVHGILEGKEELISILHCYYPTK